MQRSIFYVRKCDETLSPNHKNSMLIKVTFLNHCHSSDFLYKFYLDEFLNKLTVLFATSLCHVTAFYYFYFFQEEDSSGLPSFLKMSPSSNSISKMKAPSSTSISSIGVSPTPSRTRESVVTLNYSGARSSSELTLIESNVPKKRT